MINQKTRDMLGLFAGTGTGAGLTAYTTGMLTTSLSAPVIIGGLVGLLPVYYTKHLHQKYTFILGGSPILKTTAHFTIAASSALLGTWIGLVATSLLFNVAINPFALPALITAGISAAVILGLYLYGNPSDDWESDCDNAIPPAGPVTQSGSGGFGVARGTLMRPYNHPGMATIHFTAIPNARHNLGTVLTDASCQISQQGTSDKYILTCPARDAEKYANILKETTGVIVHVDNPAQLGCDY